MTFTDGTPNSFSLVSRTTRWSVARSAVAVLLVGAAVACNDSRPSADGAPAAPSGETSPAARPALLNPYPPGKWRLAPPGELDRVLLWVSHILVRHEGSSRQAPFGLPEWNPLPPAPARSREQALELARKLAREAREKPAEFGQLARSSSDDITTKEEGGSLGGVAAGTFVFSPGVLDALAALRAGDVSEAVETRHGFHVFHRRPAPEAAHVAGRRIVIGYADAKWLDLHRRSGREPSTRTRAEALSLAESISAKLRDGREPFDVLLDRHSEHEDAARRGDVGRWSTHELGGLAREREQLARLEVGEISRPIDSDIGFQIYVRTEAAPRPELAIATVRLPYKEGVAVDNPLSRAKARELAESVSRTLAEQPGRFAAFQAEYCCDEVVRWSEGRGSAALGQAASALAPGEIGRSPVELESAFLLLKRLDPAEVPAPPAVLFELPAPEAPDVLAFAKNVKGPAVQKLVRKIRDEAPAVLALDEARAREFRRIHDMVAELFALGTSRDKRERDLSSRMMELRTLLQEDGYARYERFVQEVVASSLMRR